MTHAGPSLTTEERQTPDAFVYVQARGELFDGALVSWWPDTRIFIFPPSPTSSNGLDAMTENSLNLTFPRGSTRVVDEDETRN